MSSKASDKSGHGAFLSEIEAINKALFPENKALSRSLNSTSRSRSISSGKLLLPPDSQTKYKYGGKDDSSSQNKDGKKSIWNWKPLKAFSTARNRTFNCRFSLQVHSIENLPDSFNGVSLCVNWKRRDASLVTRPVKAFDGTAEFDQKLIHTCSIYGTRSGPHHSAKYDAKHCLLYAEIFGSAEVDLGRHRIDLTRLLPLTLEELDDEEKCSGKWTTSFKLSGKAKGAALNVSFGYTVAGDNNNNARDMKQNLSIVKTVTKHSQGDNRGSFRRVENLPSTETCGHGVSQSAEDFKDLHEVLAVSKSELAVSVDLLYKKFDEDKLDSPLDLEKPYSYPVPESGKENDENKIEDNDSSVTEPGTEFLADEPVKSVGPTIEESPEVLKGESVTLETLLEFTRLDEESSSFKDGLVIHDSDSNMEDASKESLMNELESVLNSVSNLENEALDFPEDRVELQTEYEMNQKDGPGLDDVASEFLTNLGIDHSPFGFSSESENESPRGRLLRQFEKETLGAGCSLFGYDIENEVETQYDCNFPTESICEKDNFDICGEENFDISSFIQAAEEEHQIATEALKGKMKAKMLEDLETETLMHEWGLNEKSFQYSPPKTPSGFGSPIDILPEEPLGLPPLGEGLGPILQTNNGGFVRSMNPSLFNNAKNGGSLIMQVSSPVVVPAEMGSGVMEILQQLAAAGIEKLSMQANKLMPLDDVTGKTMQQVAYEALPGLDGPESQSYSHNDLEVGPDISVGPTKEQRRSSKPRSDKYPTSTVSSEYVSLEDLAPLAMDKIEALSMEGLRIQSGMSEDEAPSNISAQSIGAISALKGKDGGSLGLQGTAGLQLLDVKDGGDDVEGLMGLSLTLDEWMRLDSGEINDEDRISERTSKILSAHHAAPLEMIRGGEKKRGKRKCGLLGNNLTVALMVQLRDPLRNFEPVGTPMLALIQVERVFLPPKPKIYSTVSIVRNNYEDSDDESKSEVKEKKEEEIVSKEETIPQFRITEVHVAGLKPEPGKKKLWGSSNQQQSGSRWLLANGMTKSNKHPFMKSKANSKPGKAVGPVSGKPEASSTTTVQPGDTLWSISSKFNGSGAKWKELAELNPHIRNPNVILPNTKIRLREWTKGSDTTHLGVWEDILLQHDFHFPVSAMRIQL
ncbi:hypothetical protein ACFE04_016960 [Oxalis oulophora]